VRRATAGYFELDAVIEKKLLPRLFMRYPGLGKFFRMRDFARIMKNCSELDDLGIHRNLEPLEGKE
jgi:hypothetical protein